MLVILIIGILTGIDFICVGIGYIFFYNNKRIKSDIDKIKNKYILLDEKKYRLVNGLFSILNGVIFIVFTFIITFIEFSQNRLLVVRILASIVLIAYGLKIILSRRLRVKKVESCI